MNNGSHMLQGNESGKQHPLQMSHTNSNNEGQISSVQSPIYNQLPHIAVQKSNIYNQIGNKNGQSLNDEYYNSNVQSLRQQSLDQQTFQEQKSYPRSISGRSTQSQKLNPMIPLNSGIINTPAIPGKNQRILINKQRGVNMIKSAQRAFNRSQPSKTNYGAYIQSNKDNSMKCFGTTQKRFDGTFEMKELFNREPGPGSYSQTTAATSVMSSSSVSTQGFGNGFVSKSDRFNKLAPEATAQIGPGAYDPIEIRKHVMVPKIDSKTGFSLPFNEKNPLNYVKPITVNIYFKQANPGVGSYDPEKPAKQVSACQNVFQSGVDRNANNTIKLQQQKLEPGPSHYDIKSTFEISDKERMDGTRPFKQNVPKKIVPINLYNPHAEVDQENKSVPGPGKYSLPSMFVGVGTIGEEPNKIYAGTGGKIYVENNLDRFGKPIMPRRPIDLVPGPGEHDIQRDISEPILAKGGYMAMAEGVEVKDYKFPGPSYYNPVVESKKISFLFNAQEKWTQ